MPEKFIPPHGGYEDLLSFRKARIVYDATLCFCERFLNKRDRTRVRAIQLWDKNSREAHFWGAHAPSRAGDGALAIANFPS